MNNKIFAVVVTYKRSNILAQCLEAILNFSTYKIEQLHVIINDNEKSTLEIVKKSIQEWPSKISYQIFDNIGPAGGFHYGIKKFLESECDYVWLMDDDIIPESNCLQALINCTPSHPYIFSKVYNRSGLEICAFGWWGVLISKKIVQKIGLPIKDFFYWIEDTEYLQNRMIREHNIHPYRCESAVVVHLTGDRIRQALYYYYTIRNTLYYRSRIFPLNFRGVYRIIIMFLGTFYRIIFKESEKLKIFFLVISACIHALQGKLGKNEKLHQKG